MDFNKYSTSVLREISTCISTIEPAIASEIVEAILSSRRIFCDGAGRSGLQIASFAMRLMQMGIDSYTVDGITTPAIDKGDLIIICSGSGETPVLVAHAKFARAIGAQVVLVTATGESSIGKMADCVLQLSAPMKNSEDVVSIQPMGTLFEQSSGVLFDILVLLIMQKLSISNEDMVLKHKNLE